MWSKRVAILIIIFLVLALAFVLIRLGDDNLTGQSILNSNWAEDGVNIDSEDLITCCELEIDGETKSCKVMPGKSCDYCVSFCGE